MLYPSLRTTRRCEDLGLTLRGGGRGHLCSSILKPCGEKERRGERERGKWYWQIRWEISGSSEETRTHTHTRTEQFSLSSPIKISRAAAQCEIILCDNNSRLHDTGGNHQMGRGKRKRRGGISSAGDKEEENSIKAAARWDTVNHVFP